jgi:hypothetical protein
VSTLDDVRAALAHTLPETYCLLDMTKPLGAAREAALALLTKHFGDDVMGLYIAHEPALAAAWLAQGLEHEPAFPPGVLVDAALIDTAAKAL